VTELLFDDCTSQNISEEIQRMVCIDTSERGKKDVALSCRRDRVYGTLFPMRGTSLHRPSHLAAMVVATAADVSSASGAAGSRTHQLRQYSSSPRSLQQQGDPPLMVRALGGLFFVVGAGLTIFVGGVAIGVGFLGILAAIAWRSLTGKPIGGGANLYQTMKNAGGGVAYDPAADPVIDSLNAILQDSPTVTRTLWRRNSIGIGSRTVVQVLGVQCGRKTVRSEYQLVESSGVVVGAAVVVGTLAGGNENNLSILLNPLMEEIQSVKVTRLSNGKIVDLSVPMDMRKVEKTATKRSGKKKSWDNNRRGGGGGSGGGGGGSGGVRGGSSRSGQTVIEVEDFQVK
jgi:hypothetical protein